jgi:hypothetical protein
MAGASGNVASVLIDAIGVDPEELNFGVAHVAEDAIKNAVPNCRKFDTFVIPALNAIPAIVRIFVPWGLPGI